MAKLDASRAKLGASGTTRSQIGALPLRVDASRELRVMLITSRETRRWVIPKGWPMKGLKDHKAAEREALEEAGLVGQMRKQPVGVYQYWKRGTSAFELCEVTVYPMHVTQQARTWPEKDQRTTRWFSLQEAADLVDEPGLKMIIAALANEPEVGA